MHFEPNTYTTALLCFSLKTYTLSGLEPGSPVPQEEAMTTAHPFHNGCS
jgi:hypothetical protein